MLLLMAVGGASSNVIQMGRSEGRVANVFLRASKSIV